MKQLSGDFDAGDLRINWSVLPNCCPAKPQTHRTVTPRFSRRPSPDRLITVPQSQYKKSRANVQRWTTGQYGHVAWQSWTVRRSIRIVGDEVPLSKSSQT